MKDLISEGTARDVNPAATTGTTGGRTLAEKNLAAEY
jgi:hypothetical protein